MDRLEKEIESKLDKNSVNMGTEIKNLNYDIQNSLMKYMDSKIVSLESKLAVKQKEDQANAKRITIITSANILAAVVIVVLILFK